MPARSIYAGCANGLVGYTFNPTTLFSGNTGGWWDPSDLTTTFQDTAGTTPANADGQMVRRINDKSGNGNHLLNPDSNMFNIPHLKTSAGLWWINFDIGVFQYLQASFTLAQPLTRVSAAQIVTWASGTYFWDGATLNTAVLDMTGSTPNVRMYAGASGPTSTQMTVGVNHVATEFFSGASSTLAIDNNANSTGDTSTGTPGGATIGMGANLGEPSNINWFGAIWIGRSLTGAEIANCRTFFGAKAGLAL
jgi:hypothetical protein